MIFYFFKYQGTGNDFVILDNRLQQYNNITTEQVNKICDRRFGIGADGLMMLNEIEGYDFEMVYYNADGKPSSMCGNGGRCLVQFAHDLGIKKETYSFIATDGPHLANLDEQGWVRLQMIDVDTIEKVDEACVLDTGSPHYVQFVHDVMHEDVFAKGKAIRNSARYKDKGINVNFVERAGNNIIVRTYERGVENETYSCGTGVTASALAASPGKDGFHRIDIQTPGGRLAVEFVKQGDHFTDIWLCGPATFVFKGQIELND